MEHFKNDPHHICGHLISDYLETGFNFNQGHYQGLLDELRREKIAESAIEAYPSFSVRHLLVVVMPSAPPAECWLYESRPGKIRKIKL